MRPNFESGQGIQKEFGTESEQEKAEHICVIAIHSHVHIGSVAFYSHSCTCTYWDCSLFQSSRPPNRTLGL